MSKKKNGLISSPHKFNKNYRAQYVLIINRRWASGALRTQLFLPVPIDFDWWQYGWQVIFVETIHWRTVCTIRWSNCRSGFPCPHNGIERYVSIAFLGILSSIKSSFLKLWCCSFLEKSWRNRLEWSGTFLSRQFLKAFKFIPDLL